MQNKRGQELSIGTLVLIVLGIVVLVVLILGFSIGWQNFFRKVGIIQGSDLDVIANACKIAVTSQSIASYCDFKEVEIDGKINEINCEYEAVANILGSGKLSGGCSESVKNSYCTEFVINPVSGGPLMNGNRPQRESDGKIISGLRTPCPEGYMISPTYGFFSRG